MAIQAYTDFGSIIIVLVVMFGINAFAYIRQNGTYAVMAGMLGLFTLGWTFNNGQVVQAVVYCSQSFLTCFTTHTVDANLMVVVLAVATLWSFMFLYFERYS